MKKNMLAIVILAATLVNIALTALMLFTVIPKAQRTDALIQKIVSIIDLELEDPDAADYAEIPFADRQTYPLTSKVTANLTKAEGETKNPYAQVEVTLILNKTAKGYEEVYPLLASYEKVIVDIVKDEISKYTTENIIASKDVIQREVRTKLGTELGTTDLIIGVILDITY